MAFGQVLRAMMSVPRTFDQAVSAGPRTFVRNRAFRWMRIVFRGAEPACDETRSRQAQRQQGAAAIEW